MAERPAAHRSFRIEFLADDYAYSICTCGWKSERALNAGTAGALWDRHLEEVLAEEAD